ncbi:MAG: hypothetical protein IT242_11245 [Bacteroidia bacterium]|nr:hypothetical protein [Bacteroidia bacterium]
MGSKPELVQEKETTVHTGISDYDLLAGLFVYPENKTWLNAVHDAFTYLHGTCPEAAGHMKGFVEFADLSTLQEMQEIFLRSFDVQAITTLDIGFTLFGEDYKRGQLLVNLNREHREAGNVCHTELSDHLPNILRLLPKMKDEEMRNEIALKLVIPAVEKMMSEFDSKKIEKKDEIYKKNLKTIIDYSSRCRTIYLSVLETLFEVLKKDFGYEDGFKGTPSGVEEVDVTGTACGSCSSFGATSGDYTRNIETEMTLEKN